MDCTGRLRPKEVPFSGWRHTPNSKKVAFGIGNWALESYCLGIRKQWMLYLSDPKQ